MQDLVPDRLPNSDQALRTPHWGRLHEVRIDTSASLTLLRPEIFVRILDHSFNSG
jgi:hypothetical protein